LRQIFALLRQMLLISAGEAIRSAVALSPGQRQGFGTALAPVHLVRGKSSIGRRTIVACVVRCASLHETRRLMSLNDGEI
jgi:hypothetical protein